MPERFSGTAGMHSKVLVARNRRLTTALDRVLRAIVAADLQMPADLDPAKAIELGLAIGDAHLLLKEPSK